MPRPLLPCACALLALTFAACTSPTESAGDFTLETRNAFDLLPADAQVVGLLNLAEARASDAVGPLLDAGFDLETMTGEGAARIRDFVAQTGFDLMEDVERVYVAASDDQDGAFAAVLYADYDRARVDAYLQEQGDLEAERTSYRDAPLYVATDDDGDRFSFALPNDDLMLMGSDALVRAMLDRLDGGGAASLRGDAQMMALLDHAAHPDDAWFAVRKVDVGGQGDVDDALFEAGRFMQSVVISAGFGEEGLDLSFFGRTSGDTSPADVADLVRGAVSGMRMSAKDDDELIRTLDRVTVREDRDAVRVDAFVSEALLAEMRR